MYSIYFYTHTARTVVYRNLFMNTFQSYNIHWNAHSTLKINYNKFVTEMRIS